MNKKLVITGATGMIGQALCNRLKDDYQLIIITRDIEHAFSILGKEYIYVNWNDSDEIIKYLSGAYGVINLAGSNIGNKRWTKKTKNEIITSREKAGEILLKKIALSVSKPSVFIQASAIGYYDQSYRAEYNESDITTNNKFLQNVVKKWESSTKDVKKHNVRHVIARIGVVLDKKNGIFPKIYLPFRYYMGSVLGNGKQWMSWIHIDDVVNAFIFLLKKGETKGIYNLTSPTPVRQKELIQKISDISGKSAWLKIPSFILRLIFGEMADETILSSQKVLPKRLLNSGFGFQFETIQEALFDIIKKKSSKNNYINTQQFNQHKHES